MKLEEILPKTRSGRRCRPSSDFNFMPIEEWFSGLYGGYVFGNTWELESEELSIKVLNSVIPELPWIVTSHGWKTEKGIALRPHSEIDALFAARQKMTGRPALRFVPEYQEPPPNHISSRDFIDTFNRGWVACAEAHGLKGSEDNEY